MSVRARQNPRKPPSVPPFRSVLAAGLATDEAARIVQEVLERSPAFTVHEVARGRLKLVRTERPRWATVACACTVWLAGLGLLFLLVRRTEAVDLTVSEGPRGAVVVLPPLVDGPSLRAVEEALAAAGTPRSDAGFPAVDGLDDATVARRADGLDAATVDRRHRLGAERDDA